MNLISRDNNEKQRELFLSLMSDLLAYVFNLYPDPSQNIAPYCNFSNQEINPRENSCTHQTIIDMHVYINRFFISPTPVAYFLPLASSKF